MANVATPTRTAVGNMEAVQRAERASDTLMAWSLFASLIAIPPSLFGQRHFLRGLVAGALR